MDLPNARIVDFPADARPRLIVVIDTEEEFDWNAPADRNATSVDAMAHIERVQDIFDEYRIVPCYVIDYPVASTRVGYEKLRNYAADGRCEIGAHLHPWVNPPHEEEVTPRNTYPGNLPKALELAKLTHLTDQIESTFGFRPRSYKAGRYGYGPNTTDILAELGYEIDLSFCPPMDHRADGGPDYRHGSRKPAFYGPAQKLFEVPITADYVGWGPFPGPLFALASRLKALRVPGILSRLRMLDRLMLSPEGYTSDEHIRLVRSMFKGGLRTFTWSFHSPTVVPGRTPYVDTSDQLNEFLNTFRRFFDFFFGELQGVASTPTKLRDELGSNA